MRGGAPENSMNFDEEYLAALRRRDPAVCTRFYYEFAPVLESMLRYKGFDSAVVEDLRNETLCRVLVLNDAQKVQDAAKFGRFVRGVCKHVVDEYLRLKGRHGDWPEGLEPIDPGPNMEELLSRAALIALLRKEIVKLKPGERKLLEDVHVRELDRRILAKALGLSPSGLNVRLCRVVEKLRMALREKVDFPIKQKRKRPRRHNNQEGLNNDSSRRSNGKGLDSIVRPRAASRGGAQSL